VRRHLAAYRSSLLALCGPKAATGAKKGKEKYFALLVNK
jgi:hypothetical protein